MIVTDRFCDGNSSNNGTMGEEYRPGGLHFYQGGDWQGIINHLDYLQKIGFTALWISLRRTMHCSVATEMKLVIMATIREISTHPPLISVHVRIYRL